MREHIAAMPISFHLLAIEGQSRRGTGLAARWHLECKIRGLGFGWSRIVDNRGMTVQGMQGPFINVRMEQVQQLTLKIFQSLSTELQFQTVQGCIMVYKDVQVKACRSTWKSLLEASTCVNQLPQNRRTAEKQLIDRYIADSGATKPVSRQLSRAIDSELSSEAPRMTQSWTGFTSFDG